MSTFKSINQELHHLNGTQVIVCFLLRMWEKDKGPGGVDSFASVAGTLSHTDDQWRVDSNSGSHSLFDESRVSVITGQTIYINVSGCGEL